MSRRGPGENDVALIFLDVDANGFLPVEPASESPEKGDTVFMAGYGSFGLGENGRFISNSTKELDGLEAYVLRQSERYLDYQNDEGKSSCAGDSGGPMVEIDPDTGDFVLVGITRGPVLGDRQSMACRYRGQYTNYQFVASWIEENIR